MLLLFRVMWAEGLSTFEVGVRSIDTLPSPDPSLWFFTDMLLLFRVMWIISDSVVDPPEVGILWGWELITGERMLLPNCHSSINFDLYLILQINYIYDHLQRILPGVRLQRQPSEQVFVDLGTRIQSFNSRNILGIMKVKASCTNVSFSELQS